jgi:GNAT superfamily N-acetyltransferase
MNAVAANAVAAKTGTRAEEKPLTTDAEVIRAWISGWVLSRGASTPVEVPGGFEIEVGKPGHLRRYVLPAADPVVIRDLMERITEPDIWIKVSAPEDEVAPLLAPAWTLMDPGFMMTTTLRPVEVTPPAGYLVAATTEETVTVVRVLTADGQLAARGRVAVAGESATFDQISTEEDHRRRGLGSVVMNTLGNTALTQGAHNAVLGASDQGRELYLSLGWTVHSMLTSAVILPAVDVSLAS